MKYQDERRGGSARLLMEHAVYEVTARNELEGVGGKSGPSAGTIRSAGTKRCTGGRFVVRAVKE